MTAELEARFHALLERHFGRVKVMTPDPQWRVYIGVAHPLASFATALNLPFWWSAGERKGHCAQMQEITRAWYRVACEHKPFDDMYLTEEGIDDLLAIDCASCESVARQVFRGFDSFPEPAQVAILEIAWRRQDFSSRIDMQHAVNGQDWATAADLFWREDLPWERNAEVRELFLEAAAQPKA